MSAVLVLAVEVAGDRFVNRTGASSLPPELDQQKPLPIVVGG